MGQLAAVCASDLTGRRGRADPRGRKSGLVIVGRPVPAATERLVKPGPPLPAVTEGVVKPGPPLLRVNRRILVFFFRRGWSGFHAVPDRGWRGWSGFHAAPDRGRRGWSGFHAASDRVWRGWSGFHAKLEGDRQGWPGFHRGSDKGQGRRKLGSGCDEETGTRFGRRFSECLACGETHYNGSGGGPRCARKRRGRGGCVHARASADDGLLLGHADHSGTLPERQGGRNRHRTRAPGEHEGDENVLRANGKNRRDARG